MADRHPITIDEIVTAVDGTGARIGVADCAPFPDVAREMERRVASGERGQLRFGYGDIGGATDPGRSFPWGRSIVVAAVPYLAAGDGPVGSGVVDEPRRSVARFADGDRYGAVRDVLATISTTIDAAGWRTEAVWDDDRLVDRALAVRSGIAWWGKSTMALTPGLGPWFLIGSVVTDAPMEATKPMDRSCGTCVACIPACPTGAIVADGILDARRCLAAIFQGRGVIPVELRRAAGTRVYGCDDCLTSCPPGHRALAGVPVHLSPDARTILAMSDEQILDRFAHWYIPGRRARFIRRNALVALGNDPRPSDVDLLRDHLAHQDPLLRVHAAWALGMVGGERARVALADLADSGHDVIVLGDLVNLIDYRSCEGIVPDVVGAALIREIVTLRMAGRDVDARALWRDTMATLDIDVAAGVAAGMAHQYRDMSVALRDLSGLVIHGNVDDPDMLRAHLPEAIDWADGERRTIDGEVFGFVGGGVPRIGTPGEVDDDTMRDKLAALGPVDVLCTHVPPAVPMLAEDTIGGRSKGSRPIREYLEAISPRMHYYGDVHQPRATRMVLGSTLCVNVGYFRATHRGVVHSGHG